MSGIVIRCLAVAALLLGSTVTLAADLKILSTPTVRSVLQDVLPAFQQQTGHRVEVTYDPVGALKRRIEGGEAFDLAILVPNVSDELIKAGSLDVATRTVFARAGYGVAVGANAPKPDVSTVNALKKALLEAKALSCSPDSNSSAYFVSLLEKLGIAEQLKPRLKAVTGPRVVEAVGSGEADLTVITVPNIVGERGVQLAGLLPAELQNYSVFVLAAAAKGTNKEAVQALARFLQSDAVTASIKARGLERVP